MSWRSGQNLVFAYCLVLQAFAWPSYACPCHQIPDQKSADIASQDMPDDLRRDCWLCRSNTDATRCSARWSLPEQTLHQLAIAVADVSPPARSALSHATSRVAQAVLPTAGPAGLQVFLE